MKTVFTFLFLCCFPCFAKAQSFAIISDKDGYVNVRKDNGANSPIVGKIYSNDIFGYDEADKSDWIKIYKQNWEHENGSLEGYIHKSRIFPLSKFKSIKNVKSYKDSCVAVNDSLKIIIKSKLFNAKKHHLTYDRSETSILRKIDGLHIWGTDGNMPKRKISDVKLIKNGISIIVPESAFDNLFEPNLGTLQIYLGKANTIYVEMDNSDGAGAYSVIWIIKNGQYLKRYIDNSNA